MPNVTIRLKRRIKNKKIQLQSRKKKSNNPTTHERYGRFIPDRYKLNWFGLDGIVI
jgi:hypothetical protein